VDLSQLQKDKNLLTEGLSVKKLENELVLIKIKIKIQLSPLDLVLWVVIYIREDNPQINLEQTVQETFKQELAQLILKKMHIK